MNCTTSNRTRPECSSSPLVLSGSSNGGFWCEPEASVTLTLAVRRVHHVWGVRPRLHHRVLRGHARVLGCHWVAGVRILGGSQWFPIGVVHGLYWVTGHGDLLGCRSYECTEGVVKRERQREKSSVCVRNPPSNGVLPLCCRLW